MQFDFLAWPVIQVLLLAIVFLALLVEIKTAGMGVGALFGLIAAGVFFGSQMISGLVSLYEIAWFLGGILFVVLEILTPSVGIFAAVGVGCIFYSFILALGGDAAAVYLLAASLVLAMVVFAVILKRLPSSRLWEKLVLRDMETSTKGYVSVEDRLHLKGKAGTVVTRLRPSGTALIEGQRIDVISEGGYIEIGESIEVMDVQGGRVVVRKHPVS